MAKWIDAHVARPLEHRAWSCELRGGLRVRLEFTSLGVDRETLIRLNPRVIDATPLADDPRRNVERRKVIRNSSGQCPLDDEPESDE